jgi:hypothetical protein
MTQSGNFWLHYRTYKILVGNIKTDVRDAGREGVYWTKLTHEKFKY